MFSVSPIERRQYPGGRPAHRVLGHLGTAVRMPTGRPRAAVGVLAGRIGVAVGKARTGLARSSGSQQWPSTVGGTGRDAPSPAAT